MVSAIISLIIFSEVQFSVSPLSIEEVLAPGVKKQIEFVVYNESKINPASIRIYVTDIIQNQEGSYEITAIGRGVPSCANWIKLKDTMVNLKPDEAKAIVGLLQVPHNVKGSGYGAIVVENRLSTNEASFQIRMPIIVKVIIKPLSRLKAIITDIKVGELEKSDMLKISNDSKEAISIAASVRNESNRHILTKGRLVIRNKEGRRIREVPLGKSGGVILPNSTVDVKSIIKRPAVGEYVADVSINYGARSPAKARRPFEIAKQKVISRKGLNANLPLAISAMPEFIDISIFPKAFRNPTIILYNEETSNVRVNVEIKQLTNDESGELKTVEEDEENQWSCCHWLSVIPNEFTIKPNERKAVKINIQIPPEPSHGERYAQVVFNVSKDSLMPSVFNVPVFLSYQGMVNPQLKIEDIKVNFSSPVEVYVYVKNSGDVKCKPSGKLTIERKRPVTDGFGENITTIGEYALKPIRDWILAEKEIIMQTEIRRKLDKGKYNFRVELNYSKGKYVILEKEIII